MTAAFVCSLMAARPAMATPNLLYPVNGDAFVPFGGLTFAGSYDTGELKNITVSTFGVEASLGKSSSGTYAFTIYWVASGSPQAAGFALLGNRTDGSGAVGTSTNVGGSGPQSMTMTVNAGAGEFFWVLQVTVPPGAPQPFRLIGVRPTT